MLLWRIQRQNLYMTYVQCEIVLLYPVRDIRMKSTGLQEDGSRARLELQTTAGLTLVEWTRCDRKTEQRDSQMAVQIWKRLELQDIQSSRARCEVTP